LFGEHVVEKALLDGGLATSTGQEKLRCE
jgi:hypothetical protein